MNQLLTSLCDFFELPPLEVLTNYYVKLKYWDGEWFLEYIDTDGLTITIRPDGDEYLVSIFLPDAVDEETTVSNPFEIFCEYYPQTWAQGLREGEEHLSKLSTEITRYFLPVIRDIDLQKITGAVISYGVIECRNRQCEIRIDTEYWGGFTINDYTTWTKYHTDEISDRLLFVVGIVIKHFSLENVRKLQAFLEGDLKALNHIMADTIIEEIRELSHLRDVSEDSLVSVVEAIMRDQSKLLAYRLR